MELILKKEMAGLIPMPESYESFNEIKNGDEILNFIVNFLAY